MIHRSPFPDVDIPDVAVTGFVLAEAGRLGDKPALIDGPSGRVLTYAQLQRSIRSFGGGLVEAGYQHGDVLALMAPNVPEYAVVFHGAALAGGVITTVNPTYTEREVHHQLRDAGAVLLVTVQAFLATATAAVADTAVRRIYVLDGVPEGSAEMVRPVSELFREPIDQVAVDPDDLVVLPYSSGTTGLSKGVMLSHRNLVANIAQVLAPADFREDDSLVAVLPFFHIYGMQVLMNCGLRAGATIVTMPRFDLEQFLTLHAEHSISRAFVAPPIMVALAKHPVVDSFDLSSLRTIMSGAAPLSAELGDAVAQRLQCEVAQGFGMTELSPVSHLTPSGRFKAGSVGLTAPNTEMRIVDPVTGEDLGVDEPGELWVRGPQVMRGYLNNPESTAETVDDEGWLRTGDIGRVDDEGHVFVVDRLKELIKYNAFQVPPAELEALLLTHPDVADAAVVGLPDEEAGEIPAAFVVLHPGAVATEEEVMAYVAERVATYKQIRRLTFIDAVPKSTSGKILRRVLRDTPVAPG